MVDRGADRGFATAQAEGVGDIAGIDLFLLPVDRGSDPWPPPGQWINDGVFPVGSGPAGRPA